SCAGLLIVLLRQGPAVRPHPPAAEWFPPPPHPAPSPFGGRRSSRAARSERRGEGWGRSSRAARSERRGEGWGRSRCIAPQQMGVTARRFGSLPRRGVWSISLNEPRTGEVGKGRGTQGAGMGVAPWDATLRIAT